MGRQRVLFWLVSETVASLLYNGDLILLWFELVLSWFALTNHCPI